MSGPANSSIVSSTSSRSTRIILTAVLLMGAILRAAYLMELSHGPEFTAPSADGLFNDYWARGIAFDEWTPPLGTEDTKVRESPYLRAPGYPYFLAAIYAITGGGYWGPRIIQMSLGIVSALLAFVISRRILGDIAGLGAAGILSVYWVFIYFEGELLEPALLVLLILVSLYLLVQDVGNRTPYYSFAGGAALGLAALTRPNALILILPACAWIAWSGRRGAWIRRWLPATLVILGAVAMLVPSAIRNYRLSGAFIPVSANAGINLYIGNNPQADGFFSGQLGPYGRFANCFDYPRLARAVGVQVGREVDYVEVSDHLSTEAIKFVKAQPMRTLALMVRKAYLFLAPYEISHNGVPALDRSHLRVLSLLPGGFSFVASTAFMGLISLLGQFQLHPFRQSTRASRDALLLILSWVACYSLSFLPFFGSSTYRVPVIALLALMSARFVHEISGAVNERHFRRLGIGVVLWAILWAVFSIPFISYEPSSSEWHYGKGSAYLRNNDFKQAASQFEAAISSDPENVDARRAAATVATRLHDMKRAIQYLVAAVNIAPDNAEIHVDLGDAFLRTNDTANAASAYSTAIRLGPEDDRAYNNLAMMLAGDGRTEEAVAVLRAGLKIAPQSPNLHMSLGMLLVRLGTADEGLAELQKAVGLNPGMVEARINLGLALRELRRPKEALVSYQAALTLAPNLPQLHNNIAVVLEELNRTEEAIQGYRSALNLDAHLPLTRVVLGELLLERDPASAAEQFRLALEDVPGDLRAMLGLGVAYERMSDRDRAIAQFRRVLEIEPANPSAASGIRRLGHPDGH